MLGFARSLGNLARPLPLYRTLQAKLKRFPLRCISFIQTPAAEEQTARLCLFAIILSLISLLLSEWLSKRMQKKLGQGNVAN